MGSGSPQKGLGSALLWSPYALPVLHRAHVRADPIEELRVGGRGNHRVAFGVQALRSAHLERLSWLYQLSSGHINKGPPWAFVSDEVAVWGPDMVQCFFICKAS